MGRIERIADDSKVRQAWCHFATKQADILKLIVAIQQIPAPTFAEAERAAFIERRFHKLGLSKVTRDSLHNVYGLIPGSSPGTHRPVIISAHSDTVFPVTVDLATRRDAGRLYGPGIGDNSTGVAGLFAIAEAIRTFDIRPAADLWFVSNVGEEGLGDLRGMRAVVNRFGRHAYYIVVEGGLYGQIAHEAIGVKRFRISVEAPGGHSWGSFGSANAIHELAYLITAVDHLQVAKTPKSTYNVGVIEGGTSINTIAQSASMLLDLRSENVAELDRLVDQVMELVRRGRMRASRRKSDIKIAIEAVGNRPAGTIPRNTPLVRWAEEALKVSSVERLLYVSGSTDANVPLSLGIPAVCVGLTESANSHRVDEYIEVEPLPAGLKQLLLLTLAAGDYN